MTRGGDLRDATLVGVVLGGRDGTSPGPGNRDPVVARRRTHPHRRPLRDALREIIYGMAGYEFVRDAQHARAHLETIFMVVTHGDMIGLPVLPPYYSLRLLPYATYDVERWKRRVLREREFTDEHEFDLHGV
jgi:hypothetical protein